MHAHLRVAAAVAGCVVALVGCAAPPHAPTSPPVPLAASLNQQREDLARDVLQVRLHNTGRAAVVVRTLALDWPGLATSPSTPNYPLGPGVLVDLPIGYGPARCAGTPPADPGTGVAAVTVEADGVSRTVRLSLADPYRLLATLSAQDCQRQALARAVTVSFGPTWTTATHDGLPALRGELVVVRRETAAPIAVTSVDGSVLLTLEPVRAGQQPLLTLGPGVGRAALPVDVTTTGRCDGHALGESKQTYLFQVILDVGALREQGVTLEPDHAVQERMWDVLTRGCAQ